MKPIITILVAMASPYLAKGNEWQPTRDFLRAVRLVESSNGQFKSGDDGQSLGDFQLSEAAWLDVNEWRRSRQLKTYEYREAVFNEFINRVYAANYLTILHAELHKKLNRAPTHGELYAAYNMGLQMFAQCEFKLHRVNSVTRAKCRQIAMMLSGKEP